VRYEIRLSRDAIAFDVAPQSSMAVPKFVELRMLVVEVLLVRRFEGVQPNPVNRFKLGAQ
jgi:hypothetical protein